MEVGINVEGGILWKKLMHNSNKRGVEGGKKSMGLKTWRVDFFFCGGWNFSKSVSVAPRLLER